MTNDDSAVLETKSQGMTISQFRLVLRARWRLATAVWLATMAIVIGFNLSTTTLYSATAAVVVDSRAVDAMVGAGVAINGSLPGYMATQVDIAQSERVVLKAIHSLHLDDNDDLQAQWSNATGGRGAFRAWVVELLQKRFVVRPSRDSNAMTLSFADPDPDRAAQITNALLQAYIDTTLELRVEPLKRYNAFFDERSRQLRDSLEKAQTRLSSYQQQNGLLTTEERFDVEGARLTELSSQVVLMQSAAADTGARSAEASANPDRIPEVLNSPLISAMTTDLSRLEGRLQELRSRLGDNHPAVSEARASVTEVGNRLAAAKRSASGSVGGANSVTKGRLDQAQAALARQRTRVLDLKAKRDEAAVLQRDVENAQRAYDAVLGRVSQTDLESQNRQTNVSVLQVASPPAFPSSPKTLLNAAVGSLLGLLLGLAAVLIREMGDRRMRSEEDVTFVLAQQLLMILPNASWTGRRTEARLAHRKMRVLDARQRSPAR